MVDHKNLRLTHIQWIYGANTIQEEEDVERMGRGRWKEVERTTILHVDFSLE